MPLEAWTTCNLTDEDFRRFRELVYRVCGINLTDAKRELLRSRLTRRLNRLGLKSFNEYWDYVRRDDTREELVAMIDAITTNKTDFLRESGHFELLARQILPPLVEGGKTPIRIWSAACSTGEEPYTIALTIREKFPSLPATGAKILATDIAPSVLRHGMDGIYDRERLNPIPDPLRRKYFAPTSSATPNKLRVSPELHRMVTFGRLNLMDDEFPMRHPMDAIFCRNVMIYFDRQTQDAVIGKLVRHLGPHGYLMIGHSETLQPQKFGLRGVGPSAYQRV